MQNKSSQRPSKQEESIYSKNKEGMDKCEPISKGAEKGRAKDLGSRTC